MHFDNYSTTASTDSFQYHFTSIGKNGDKPKIIEYELLPIKEIPWFSGVTTGYDIYNLALLDLMPDGSVSDITISDNDDRDKILRTVAKTVLDFWKYNPNTILYFEGSTPVRTRLYRWKLSEYFSEIPNFISIYGYREANGCVVPFSGNTDFEYFIFTKTSDE